MDYMSTYMVVIHMEPKAPSIYGLITGFCLISAILSLSASSNKPEHMQVHNP